MAAAAESDSDAASWQDWESGDEGEVPLRSFDGSRELASMREWWADVQQHTGLDAEQLIRDLQLDFFGRIRLVNYLRRHVGPVEENESRRAAVDALKDPSANLWQDENLLHPVVPDDPVLRRLDEDSDSEEEDEEAILDAAGKAGTAAEVFPSSVAELRAELARAKAMIQRLTSTDDGDGVEGRGPAGESAADGSSSANVGLEDQPDSSYFASYSHIGIHEEMLKDKTRTLAYRHALTQPAMPRWLASRDGAVLDVGCGTGILSMFAGRAGARRVIGVDSSDILDDARQAVWANGLQDRVTLLRSRVEALSETEAQHAFGSGVDVLVSEWMGYALLFESMLTSVLLARDRWLRPGGLMLPDRARLFVHGLEDADWYSSHIGYWSDVYGFDMAHLRRYVLEEPQVVVVPASSLGTPPVELRNFDLLTVSDAELDFTSTFAFPMVDGTVKTIHGIVISFDTEFTGRQMGNPEGDAIEGWEHVRLCTRPESTPTHWKQTVLWLEQPLEVHPGSQAEGKITFRRDNLRRRQYHFDLEVSVGDDRRVQTFHMC